MKALVWHGPRDLRLEDRPEPIAGPDQVIVEVAYCGICGTDLHEYTEGPVLIRPTRHPLTGEAPPVVLGHEFSGRVAAVGARVDNVEVGERVTVDPYWRCGRCWWCERGDYHLCPMGGGVGLASDGALAPYVRVQAAGIVRLPDEVNDRTGALVEPLAVGLHAIERGRVAKGERVAILGFGPVGAAVALMAKAAGAFDILVAEPQPGRRALARNVVEATALDPVSGDVRAQFYELTDRRGPDVVFECSARPGNVEAALRIVRRGGRVVLLGVGHGEATITPLRLVVREQELIGSIGYRHDLPRVVSLLASGRLDASSLITRVVGMGDAIKDAFEMLTASPTGDLKVLIEVGSSRR
jgi:(R,R)-butanediol dehydrogenase/meso-butanediol dehydrogenase/diacetyl reductase